MAITKAEWEYNDNKHLIRVGGKVSYAILTVDDISDDGLLDCYKYILRNKKTIFHEINGEAFPFSEDAVLDVSYDLRDILKTLDDVVGEGVDAEVFKHEREKGMCRYLIGANGYVYELTGYSMFTSKG